MHRGKIFILVGALLLIPLPILYVFAATNPEQEMRSHELQEKEKALRQKIEEPRKAPEAPPELPPTQPGLESLEKVTLKKIDVIGATLIPARDIRIITGPLEGKEVTIRDLQKAADRITDIYRQKGYITSRAYLPPQKIAEGLVEIRIVEGITGNLEIKGNRYFKTALLREKINLKKGEPFQYELLKKGLSRINEQPDRNAKAVLAPGKEPGTTDVVVEVKDNLPIHAGFTYDDYASHSLDRNRFKTTLSHDNLLGFDDVLTAQYQVTEGERYVLWAVNYLMPANENLKLGLFVAHSTLAMGRDYEDLEAKGNSKYYSMFATQSLFVKDNASLKLNVGFDYKDIFNYQLGRETSRDRLRVAKAGLEFDASDKFGRTLLTNEVAVGIPDIMGGLKKRDSAEQGIDASKGVGGSRNGSGGEFIKHTINLLRLQKMPFDTIIYWKNQAQITSDILTASEQFQIGGISNVRGYPSAEAVGDRGFSSTVAFSVPFYFIPKNINAPFSKARLYDSIRLVTFYDWANTRLRRTVAPEEKNKTLSSVGYGIRIMLPENFSVRVEFAWPLNNLPSDGKHMRSWTEISKSF